MSMEACQLARSRTFGDDDEQDAWGKKLPRFKNKTLITYSSSRDFEAQSKRYLFS